MQLCADSVAVGPKGMVVALWQPTQAPQQGSMLPHGQHRDCILLACLSHLQRRFALMLRRPHVAAAGLFGSMHTQAAIPPTPPKREPLDDAAGLSQTQFQEWGLPAALEGQSHDAAAVLQELYRINLMLAKVGLGGGCSAGCLVELGSTVQLYCRARHGHNLCWLRPLIQEALQGLRGVWSSRQPSCWLSLERAAPATAAFVLQQQHPNDLMLHSIRHMLLKVGDGAQVSRGGSGGHAQLTSAHWSTDHAFASCVCSWGSGRWEKLPLHC